MQLHRIVETLMQDVIALRQLLFDKEPVLMLSTTIDGTSQLFFLPSLRRQAQVVDEAASDAKNGTSMFPPQHSALDAGISNQWHLCPNSTPDR